MFAHVSRRYFMAAALLAAAAATAACARTEATERTQSRVERGQYLVTIGGCNDCHTPLKMGPKGPEPDMDRMLSGHPENFPLPISKPAQAGPEWMMSTAASGSAFSGPWGVSFPANLTPDNNTGIGIWTEDMFIKTLRTGKHWGTSRDILPPMPWFNYAQMTDEDLKAVYAYLRTIKPISNHVPDPIPPIDAQSAENRTGQPASGAAE
jgi:mono/diheme cytochrome c family protein